MEEPAGDGGSSPQGRALRNARRGQAFGFAPESDPPEGAEKEEETPEADGSLSPQASQMRRAKAQRHGGVPFEKGALLEQHEEAVRRPDVVSSSKGEKGGLDQKALDELSTVAPSTKAESSFKPPVRLPLAARADIAPTAPTSVPHLRPKSEDSGDAQPSVDRKGLSQEELDRLSRATKPDLRPRGSEPSQSQKDENKGPGLGQEELDRLAKAEERSEGEPSSPQAQAMLRARRSHHPGDGTEQSDSGASASQSPCRGRAPVLPIAPRDDSDGPPSPFFPSDEVQEGARVRFGFGEEAANEGDSSPLANHLLRARRARASGSGPSEEKPKPAPAAPSLPVARKGGLSQDELNALSEAKSPVHAREAPPPKGQVGRGAGGLSQEELNELSEAKSPVHAGREALDPDGDTSPQAARLLQAKKAHLHP